mmetsp:Transcript_22390/g.88617  ORF Transcript_22390/g.88617 Transcript_22390/m.88617 type:complete len:310 (+) Transcript_22390:1481-2410(+)
MARGPPRPHRRHAGLPGLPDPHRLPRRAARAGAGHHRQCGRRAGRAGRPAAGGAHPERPLRAERGQRPLGLAVRRALRHRRHPRDRRRHPHRRLQPGARCQGHRLRPPGAGPGRPAGQRLACRRHRLPRGRRPARRDAGLRRHHRPAGPGRLRGLPGRRRRAEQRAAGAPRPAPGCAHRPRHAHRQERPRRRGRRGDGSSPVHHPGPGGLGGCGGCRGQDPGLPQLAGHPARHADRGGSQGWHHLHAAPQPGPRLHRSGRRHADAAWPLPHVRAQRGPPDDQPGHPAGRWQRDSGRHPGRRGHDHHRAA